MGHDRAFRNILTLPLPLWDIVCQFLFIEELGRLVILYFCNHFFRFAMCHEVIRMKIIVSFHAQVPMLLQTVGAFALFQLLLSGQGTRQRVGHLTLLYGSVDTLGAASHSVTQTNVKEEKRKYLYKKIINSKRKIKIRIFAGIRNEPLSRGHYRKKRQDGRITSV
jgi:hypothetical protein